VTAAEQIQALMREFYLQSPYQYDETTGQFVEISEFPPFPRTDDLLYIGTDEGEFHTHGRDMNMVADEQRRVGRLPFCLVSGDADVFVSGLVAWVVDQPTLLRYRRPSVPLRLTAILRLDQGEWRFAHVHLSAGVKNEELWGHRLTTSIDDLAASVEAPQLGALGAQLTIVFTDIASSTDYMTRIGDESWLELVRWHNWKVREAVVAHGGREVKAQGDGFMLAFDEAELALDCMLSLLRTFAEQDGNWDPAVLRVRMGAHTGTMSKDLGDYYGTAVVTAARIAATAEGGEALISESIATALPGYKLGEPRRVTLKGLPGMHTLYPLVGQPPEGEAGVPSDRPHPVR
jgi:class 3 adenylate cyclase